MGNKAKIAFGLLFVLFIAFVVYSSTHLGEYTCEICMEYNGLTECATATGLDELEARNSAINVACAKISSGVTQGIACGNGTPKSVDCRRKGDPE